MDGPAALALIQQHGLWGLSMADGCLCAHFHIQGISVDVSCHKSEHCIRVYSRYLYRDALALEPIAREVLRQLDQHTNASAYRVRFCEWQDDHQNGRWEARVWREEQRCAYCHKPRPTPESYLCSECDRKEEARAYYPWRGDGFYADPADGEHRQGGPVKGTGPNL